jgi:hypothetical protein
MASWSNTDPERSELNSYVRSFVEELVGWVDRTRVCNTTYIVAQHTQLVMCATIGAGILSG